MGWKALQQSLDLGDERVLSQLAAGLTEGDLAAPQLRSEAAGDAASKVSALPAVRAALLQRQRDVAARPPLGKAGAVLDGRDVGTTILPDATVKLFVTASAEVLRMRLFVECLRGRTLPFAPQTAVCPAWSCLFALGHELPRPSSRRRVATRRSVRLCLTLADSLSSAVLLSCPPSTRQVRAQRRLKELLAKPGPGTTFDRVLADIRERDARDSSRSESPLAQAPDALLLDTSALDAAQALAEAVRAVEARLCARGIVAPSPAE